MTVHTTPVYGLGYIDTDTQLQELAAASQTLAEQAEAALLRGGVAPPLPADYSSVVGRVTTNETNIAANGAAITALATAMRRGWVDLTSTTGAYSQKSNVGAWAFLPSQVVTLAVPAGQCVEAMFHSPCVSVPASGDVWVKFGIYAGTAPAAAAMNPGIGGAAYRAGSSAVVPAEMMLHASYKNTTASSQTVTLQTAAISTVGTGATFFGNNLSPVGIKARLL